MPCSGHLEVPHCGSHSSAVAANKQPIGEQTAITCKNVTSFMGKGESLFLGKGIAWGALRKRKQRFAFVSVCSDHWAAVVCEAAQCGGGEGAGR